MPPRKAETERSPARGGHAGTRLLLAGAVALVGMLGCAAHGSPTGPLLWPWVGLAASPPAPSIHVVEPGDTVWEIARGRSRCVRAILAASGVTDARRIRPGARLSLPTDACPWAPNPTPAPVRAAAGGRQAGSAALERARLEAVAQGAPAEGSDAVSSAPSDVAAAPVTSAARRGLEDALDIAEAHLRAARFEEALAAAREVMRVVRDTPELEAADALRAHVVAAHVHVALADRTAARRSLARALDVDPGLALDPDSTSPKVLEVLAEERAGREVRSAERVAALAGR
jgi:LysM repeat protein